MNECYEDIFSYKGMTQADMDRKMSEYVPGFLQKRFESGDETVKEVIVMNIYTKSVKLSLVYDKNMTKLKQTDNFEGLLTVSDLDRLLWSSSGLEGQVD